MAHFAKINSDNIVTEVVVINNSVILDKDGNEQESLGVAFCTQLYGAGTYKQTSYNTHGGQHILGGTPLRKNYAGVGYTYDASKDAFIPPKPFNSWTLNETTCLWEAPVSYPSDGKDYDWDEDNRQWVEG